MDNNIFEYKDWLDTHSKEDSLYKYYEQKYNARKKLLNVFWTPYFEEIKWKTESIQKILEDLWYENIDLALKSLIIDWIKFFLNKNYEISVKDDVLFDDYFLWLFDSLKINTKNEKLLKDILTELESWWEDLPESPRNILVDYQFNKKDKKTEAESTQPDNNELEIAEKIKPNYLQPIIDAFWNKKEAFIWNLRKTWVEEERLEFVFLVWLLQSIMELLEGKDISEKKILFERYNIDMSNKNRLAALKEAIELRLFGNSNKAPNKATEQDSQVTEIEPINEETVQYKTPGKYSQFTDTEPTDEEVIRYETPEKSHLIRERWYKNFNNRINWKKLIRWHCAYDDGPEWLKLFGETLIKYEIWDEYIPIDNSCSHEIWTLEKVNLVKAYDLWDRFTVEKPTYSENIEKDFKLKKNWFVNIRSQKTWKVYKALSN